MGLSLQEKLARRRVQRRGATCRRDRRGNLVIRQVVFALFLLSDLQEDCFFLKNLI